jgi:hypothetical protein
MAARLTLRRDAAAELLLDARARRTPLSRLPHAVVDDRPLADPDVVDIVTVAFENPDVVRWQHELLSRNLRDPFRHTIVDNSRTPAIRERIRDESVRRGTGYVDVSRLTRRVASGSASHGVALNWAWYRLLRPRRARVVAFLDHDVYPIAPTSLREHLGPAGMFGDVQRKGDRWYLWAGLCAFARERLAGAAVDFRPQPGVADTGGRNWRALYAGVDVALLASPHHRYGQLREGADPQSDFYELIGDWLHSINGSGWKPVADRDELVTELLRPYLGDDEPRA